MLSSSFSFCLVNSDNNDDDDDDDECSSMISGDDDELSIFLAVVESDLFIGLLQLEQRTLLFLSFFVSLSWLSSTLIVRILS